ncbi:uncharacterized protein NPIL_589291 [Nephila pilipes]|uniref:Uncharacterized protein n=1 Tax=Nephila pilipes TaxID=299642 RepID=A0A8X6PDK6_NEPPI|nr:uncharacterized protein NPIL_589291 [Nephila pilipes]
MYEKRYVYAGKHKTMAYRFIFSDESTFNLSGKVNQYNIPIWGMEKPFTVSEHERGSATFNVLSVTSSLKLYGPFSFYHPVNCMVISYSVSEMLHQMLTLTCLK